jgi:hypothetical protein
MKIRFGSALCELATGSEWDSGLPRPTIGKWFHIVAVWRQDGISEM